MFNRLFSTSMNDARTHHGRRGPGGSLVEYLRPGEGLEPPILQHVTHTLGSVYFYVLHIWLSFLSLVIYIFPNLVVGALPAELTGLIPDDTHGTVKGPTSSCIVPM